MRLLVLIHRPLDRPLPLPGLLVCSPGGRRIETARSADTKKGKLRDYAIPIEWNYGAFPQTWEQPDHAWAGMPISDSHPSRFSPLTDQLSTPSLEMIGLEALASKGDNDPLDLVDLSESRVECGSIIEVKPLAVLAMIDEGEVDWKVVCVNAADPKAALINSLDDVETHFPGQIARVREWFTWYKAVDGAPGDGPLGSNKKEDAEPNVFGFDGEAKDATKAMEVVEETHASWKALKDGVVAPEGLALE